MTCESKTYNDITFQVFQNLKEKVKEQGIFFPDGNNGSVSGQGISGHYVWDENGQTLTIGIKSKPWFLPYEVIYKMIGDEVHHSITS